MPHISIFAFELLWREKKVSMKKDSLSRETIHIIAFSLLLQHFCSMAFDIFAPFFLLKIECSMVYEYKSNVQQVPSGEGIFLVTYPSLYSPRNARARCVFAQNMQISTHVCLSAISQRGTRLEHI